jgi:hypothetical protein
MNRDIERIQGRRDQGALPTGPGRAADPRTGQGLAWHQIGELLLLAFVPSLDDRAVS